MDAAAEPIITVTVVVTRFNSTDDDDDDDDDDNVLAQITSQSTVASEVPRYDAVCGYITTVSVYSMVPAARNLLRILFCYIDRPLIDTQLDVKLTRKNTIR